MKGIEHMVHLNDNAIAYMNKRGGAHQLVIVSMESMMLRNPRLFI